MTRQRCRSAILSGALLLGAVALAVPLIAGEIALTVVNIETPQGVKIWEPPTIVAKKGDTVALKLINRHAEEHGFEIAAFGVKEVVDGTRPRT
jgi:FtsP/CotA-like multicopper oxidase with cupredoxin domain